MSILAVGTMSGTSLDGIDIALCRFWESDERWNFEILDAKTVYYSTDWKGKLRNAPALGAQEFLKLNNEYGRYTGDLINQFLQGFQPPDLIASHGHTIFHQPENSFTFQLGNGAAIAAKTNITTVSDFRNLDVALGGQGAPLVPVGDQLLFPEFGYCLNIGGFANISFLSDGKRVAFDICPANIILNEMAMKKGFNFDQDGQIGALGHIDNQLLLKLNNLGYYKQKWPKSLAREWIEREITPLLAVSGLSVEDQAATFYEHIAVQIASTIINNGNMLVTGGGAHNSFLLGKLKSKISCRITLPEQKLVDFKEALIFAFLGVLTSSGKINVYSSTTGSTRDHIGGTIFRIERDDKTH